MGKLKINHYVVGPVQTNCYFAINEETKELIIIDPGDAAKQLAERIRKEGCKPVAILLTHGHFDHASAAEELAKEFGIMNIPTLLFMRKGTVLKKVVGMSSKKELMKLLSEAE